MSQHVCMYKKCVEFGQVCKRDFCKEHCEEMHGADHGWPDKPVTTPPQYTPITPILLSESQEVAA